MDLKRAWQLHANIVRPGWAWMARLTPHVSRLTPHVSRLISHVRTRWVWMTLLAGVLTVYLLTLAPGTLGGDPGELQFVPYILSMPHPTGTPLYCLLGKLWSMLPLSPSVAWRMNLLAAVSASLAVVMVYHCVYMLFERPVPALAAALSLALSLTFWEQALLADKYAFNALMVSLVITLALRWGKTRAPSTLNLLALTYGLSLTHHRTMALFAPSLLAYVWWHERRALWRDGRRLLRLALLCAVPLFLYLYLPWAESRNLPPGTWHPRTARQWFDYLFDTGRTGLVYVDPADLGEMLSFYVRTLRSDFTWVGMLLGMGGLVWQFLAPQQFLAPGGGGPSAFARRWPDGVFLLVNYVLQAFLAANHHVPRHWVYFIPSFVIFALWMGGGLSAISFLTRLRERAPSIMQKGIGITLTLAMLAWPLLPFYERYRPLREAHLGAGVLDVWRQTLKQGHMGDRLGEAIADVEANAIIVCDWEQATPLWYFQQVEGLRPDVQIVYPIERLDEVAGRALLSEPDRPLYLARTLPGVAYRWHPSCSSSLIALRPSPTFKLPPGISPLNVQFTDVDGVRIELAGFRYGSTGFRPPQVVPLTLYWRAARKLEHDYSVSLRLLNGAGEQIFKVDGQHPVLGSYPTSMWTVGEIVGDYYEIQLPPHLAAGTVHWGVILYRALPEGGWRSLKVAGTDAEMAAGGSFETR
jgi:hypothetical protein